MTLVAALLACSLSAFAAAPAHSAPSYLAACSTLTLEERPTSWSPGCAGASPIVDGLAWSGWGSPGGSATAVGAIRINDCQPSCAGGTFHPYPVTMVVSGRERCSWGKSRYGQYTHVRLDYALPDPNPLDRPSGPQTWELNVGSSRCVRDRRQAVAVAESTLRAAVAARSWDSPAVARARSCRLARDMRIVCRIYAAQVEEESWRGRIELSVGPVRVGYVVSGIHRTCIGGIGCRQKRFSWRGSDPSASRASAATRGGWRTCAPVVVGRGESADRGRSIVARRVRCRKARRVVRSFLSQTIGSSGATTAVGYGCYYKTARRVFCSRGRERVRFTHVLPGGSSRNWR